MEMTIAQIQDQELWKQTNLICQSMLDHFTKYFNTRVEVLG